LALKIVNYYAINVFHQSNFRISRMHRYATLREAHVKRLACSEKRTEIHQPLAQRRMLGLFPLVVHRFPEETLRPLSVQRPH
jgi:hypothetical protein